MRHCLCTDHLTFGGVCTDVAMIGLVLLASWSDAKVGDAVVVVGSLFDAAVGSVENDGADATDGFPTDTPSASGAHFGLKVVVYISPTLSSKSLLSAGFACSVVVAMTPLSSGFAIYCFFGCNRGTSHEEAVAPRESGATCNPVFFSPKNLGKSAFSPNAVDLLCFSG